MRMHCGMGRRRLVIWAFTAGTAALVLLFVGVVSARPPPNQLAVLAAVAGVAPGQPAVGRLFAGFSTGNTAGVVHRLERRVGRMPHDGDALAVLALAYQQRARETGDPAYYRLSDTALRRASAAGGPLSLIGQGEASLANTRHRFRDGLRLAREAIRLDPENGAAALEAPGIASFARVANARELIGRPRAAIAADELALEADATIPEQIAWTITQIGNVDFN